MEGALDEIEAIGSRGGEMVGVPTGFADLDELTNGLHPGQMVVVAARPAVGKALALDTPLVTPTGWTTMGEVAVGDRLMGADGHPTTVVAATEVMSGRPCFEVEFADGTVIVADAEHELADRDRRRRRFGSVRGSGRRGSWPAPCGSTEPARHGPATGCATCVRCSSRDADLTVPPYLLGVAVQRCVGGGVRARPRAGAAPGRRGGRGGCLVAGRRPRTGCRAEALRAAEPTRRDLLAGLLDRAGEITPRGCVRVPPLPAGLASDVHDLAAGLGYQCRETRCDDGRVVLTLCADDDVFRMESKRLIHKRLRADRADDSCRVVVDVRRVRSVPVRCVEVDNDDHLYLAGRAMVPTHNSTLGLDIARSAAIKSNMATCIFSLEMSRNEITMRLLSAEARVPLHHMRTGRLTDDDWTRLARRMGEVSDAPLFIDDSPNMSMMEIRAKCRRLKQRHDLKLVDHRLPAADVERQAGREPPAGGVGVLPRHSSCWPRSSRSR